MSRTKTPSTKAQTVACIPCPSVSLPPSATSPPYAEMHTCAQSLAMYICIHLPAELVEPIRGTRAAASPSNKTRLIYQKAYGSSITLLARGRRIQARYAHFLIARSKYRRMASTIIFRRRSDAFLLGASSYERIASLCAVERPVFQGARRDATA
jgi:hypothetical protein